jgi:hypothetical protein
MNGMDAKAAASRWYSLTPDRLIVGLLTAECLLWISDRLGWPTWHKGYAVLSAIAIASAAIILMILWLLVALVLRRRFQFSLRALLVLVVAVALPFSWLCVEMKLAQQQNEAVAALDATACTIDYDYVELNEADPWGPPLPPAEPSWLLAIVGRDFFHNATSASMLLVGKKVTNSMICELQRLPRLESFTTIGMDLDDDGLANICRIKHLKSLSLHLVQVTNAGLEHLQDLPKLESLEIFDNPASGVKSLIDDQSLGCLERLRGLKKLILNGTRVTEAGATRLRQALPNCNVEWSSGWPET